RHVDLVDQWSYQWSPAAAILSRRRDDQLTGPPANHATNRRKYNRFVRIDVRSGGAISLKRLAAAARGHGDYAWEFFTVSPDGRWILWHPLGPSTYACRLDGSKLVSWTSKRLTIHGVDDDRPYWLSDNRHWCHFIGDLSI